MMKLLRGLKANKSGASAAEYALIVAVMGGLVVIGATTLGTGFGGAMTDAKTTMESAGNPAP